MAKRRIAKLIAGEVDKLGVGKSLGDEYAVKLEAAAAKKPRKKRAKKSSNNDYADTLDAKQPKQPRDPKYNIPVDDYVRRLNEAGSDEKKFYEVFNEIKERNLPKKKLNELLSKYGGYDDPKLVNGLYKTPEQKLRQLEMRMREKEATEVYGRIIRKTNPWQ